MNEEDGMIQSMNFAGHRINGLWGGMTDILFGKDFNSRRNGDESEDTDGPDSCNSFQREASYSESRPSVSFR